MDREQIKEDLYRSYSKVFIEPLDPIVKKEIDNIVEKQATVILNTILKEQEPYEDVFNRVMAVLFYPELYPSLDK